MTDKNGPIAGQGDGARAESSQQPNARSELEKRQPKLSHPAAEIFSLADFQGIFRDPRWRLYRPEVTAPHRVYVREHDEGKIAALIVRRTRAEGDWPLGRRALAYVADAERDGRIARGYILLWDNRWVAVAFARAGEVVKRIGNATPTTGPLSDFYWIDVTFKPTTGYRGAGDDEEIPF